MATRSRKPSQAKRPSQARKQADATPASSTDVNAQAAQQIAEEAASAAGAPIADALADVNDRVAAELTDDVSGPELDRHIAGTQPHRGVTPRHH